MSLRKRQEVQAVLRKEGIKRSYSKDSAPLDAKSRTDYMKVVNAMVELDQMKQELQTYESPLAEVRDSL